MVLRDPIARRGYGITAKLTLALTLFTTGVALVLGLGAYGFGRILLIEGELDELETLSVEKEAAVDAWVNERSQDVARIANSASLALNIAFYRELAKGPAGQGGEFRRIHDWMQEHVQLAGPFESILLLEPETGRVFYSNTVMETGTYKENREYFLAGRKQLFVQQPFYSITRQAPSMVISAPIFDSSQNLLAVIAARLRMDELNAIMQRRNDTHETDDVYLVNRARLFVTQPRLAGDAATLQRGVRGPNIDACIGGGRGRAVTTDYRRETVISVFRWLPARQLCLVAQIDRVEAFRPVDRLAAGLALVTIFTVLVAGAIARYLSRGITQPVLALKGGVETVAEGNYGETLDVHSADELADLVDGFNSMSRTLAEKDALITAHSRTLEERVERRTAELRAAQAELVKQEKLATLGQLTATVSHELRNPLGTISTSAFVAGRVFAGGDPRGISALERISRTVARCDRIIDELLDFTRVRTPELQETPVGAWLDEIVSEIQKPERVALTLELPEDDVTAMIDPDSLRRAVVNLVENAVQAAEAAEREAPRVTVRVEAGDRDLAIRVRDNGSGIDEALVARIFEPLFSTKNFGVGLGLAIVRQIATQHGGRVTVESTPGEGSIFILCIPKKTAGQEEWPAEDSCSPRPL